MPKHIEIGPVSLQNFIWFLAVVSSVLGSKYINVTTVLGHSVPENKFPLALSGENFPCQSQEIITLEENLKQLSEQAELLQSEIATKQDIISKASTETKRLTDENNELRKRNHEKAKIISQFRGSYFTNKYEDTELHFAANRKDAEAIKRLIQLGMDINTRNNFHETPLHRAAVDVGTNKSVELKIIKYLINEGADVFAKDLHNRTFLHNLASTEASFTPNQFHNMTDYLIQKNLTSLFNVPNKKGKTPLMFAVETMELEIATLTLLHKNGINFNYPGSVLHWAIWGNRNAEFISSLIALGAEWNYTRPSNGESLLHVAAYVGNLGAVKLLLELGLDINSVDVNGRTPLHRVVILGGVNILEKVRPLVESGADVKSRDKIGLTPFEHFRRFEHVYDPTEYLFIRRILDPK